jgi:hypothetical protein
VIENVGRDIGQKIHVSRGDMLDGDDHAESIAPRESISQNGPDRQIATRQMTTARIGA